MTRQPSDDALLQAHRHQVLEECRFIHVLGDPDIKISRSTYLQRTFETFEHPEKRRFLELDAVANMRPAGGRNTTIPETELHRRILLPRSRSLIFGDGGNGKTEFTRQLAFKLADQMYRQDQRGMVPVRIELRELGPLEAPEQHEESSRPLMDRLRQCSGVLGRPEAQSLLDALLKDGRVLLILDGLDEVPAAASERFAPMLRNAVINGPLATCAMVLAGRPTGITNDIKAIINDAYRYQPRPLDFRQIEQYVRAYFQQHQGATNDAAELAAAIRSSPATVADLLSSPLMLAMTCLRWKFGRRQLPASPSALMEDGLRTLLGHRFKKNDQPDTAQIAAAMDELAKLASGSCPSFMGLTVEEATKHVPPARLDVLASESGLFWRDARTGVYGFSIQPLAEYLAGRAIGREQDVVSVRASYCGHAWHPLWRRVLFWVVGELAQSEEQAKRDLPQRLLDDLLTSIENKADDVADTLLIRACDVLGACGHALLVKNPSDSCPRLLNRIRPGHPKDLKRLARLGRDLRQLPVKLRLQIYRPTVDLVTDKDSNVRYAVRAALQEAALDPQMQARLCDLLTHKDHWISDYAAETLQRASLDPLSLSRLSDLLAHEDYFVKVRAAQALRGAPLDPQTQDRLCDLLAHKGVGVKAQTAQALRGAPLHPRTLRRLRDLMTHADNQVKMAASLALRGAPLDPQTLSWLSDQLTHENRTKKQSAATALQEAALDLQMQARLCDLLTQEDQRIWDSAAKALQGASLDPQTLHRLSDLLTHEDNAVKVAAARALKGAPLDLQAQGRLCDLLTHEDDKVVSGAFDALQSAPLHLRIRARLSDALTHKDKDVKAAAAIALYGATLDLRTTARLSDLLTHEDDYVKEAAARALQGAPLDPQTQGRLWDLLTHGNWRVRCAAVQALSQEAMPMPGLVAYLVDAGEIEYVAVNTREREHAVFLGKMKRLVERFGHLDINLVELKTRRGEGVAVIDRSLLSLDRRLDAAEQGRILLAEWDLEPEPFAEYWKWPRAVGRIREEIKRFAERHHLPPWHKTQPQAPRRAKGGRSERRESAGRARAAKGRSGLYLYTESEFLAIARAMKEAGRVPRKVLEYQRRYWQDIGFRCVTCMPSRVLGNTHPGVCPTCGDAAGITKMLPKP